MTAAAGQPLCPVLSFSPMAEPEYVICLNCDTPTYNFEWSQEKIVTVLCETCGNDEPSEFLTESEYEELTS